MSCSRQFVDATLLNALGPMFGPLACFVLNIEVATFEVKDSVSLATSTAARLGILFCRKWLLFTMLCFQAFVEACVGVTASEGLRYFN